MRMRAHCAGAQQVAEYLESRPEVAYVAYPGLASHPQHALATRTLDGGYGGMLAFALDGPPGCRTGSSRACASSPRRCHWVTTSR